MHSSNGGMHSSNTGFGNPQQQQRGFGGGGQERGFNSSSSSAFNGGGNTSFGSDGGTNRFSSSGPPGSSAPQRGGLFTANAANNSHGSPVPTTSPGIHRQSGGFNPTSSSSYGQPTKSFEEPRGEYNRGGQDFHQPQQQSQRGGFQPQQQVPQQQRGFNPRNDEYVEPSTQPQMNRGFENNGAQQMPQQKGFDPRNEPAYQDNNASQRGGFKSSVFSNASQQQQQPRGFDPRNNYQEEPVTGGGYQGVQQQRGFHGGAPEATYQQQPQRGFQQTVEKKGFDPRNDEQPIGGGGHHAFHQVGGHQQAQGGFQPNSYQQQGPGAFQQQPQSYQQPRDDFVLPPQGGHQQHQQPQRGYQEEKNDFAPNTGFTAGNNSFNQQNTTSGGYGQHSTPSGGFGHQTTTSGGFGQQNPSSGGFEQRNTTSRGFGQESTPSGGFGHQNTSSGGFGQNNTTSGGFASKTNNFEQQSTFNQQSQSSYGGRGGFQGQNDFSTSRGGGFSGGRQQSFNSSSPSNDFEKSNNSGFDEGFGQQKKSFGFGKQNNDDGFSGQQGGSFGESRGNAGGYGGYKEFHRGGGGEDGGFRGGRDGFRGGRGRGGRGRGGPRNFGERDGFDDAGSNFGNNDDEGFGGGRGGGYREFSRGGGYGGPRGGGRGGSRDGDFGRNSPNQQDRQQQQEEKKERAPAGWIPAEADVDELFIHTRENVTEFEEIEVDQEFTVQGADDIRINSWENSGLADHLVEVLKEKCSFEKPRPIQSVAMPQIMAGKDVIAQAVTGSGKTLAFVLPIVDKILKMEETLLNNKSLAPIAIVLEPTRELAVQIADDFRKMTAGTELRVVTCIGQMDRIENLKALTTGVDVLVGSVGRVLDFVESHDISNCRLRFIVLDEGDRLLCARDEENQLHRMFNYPSMAKTAATRQTLMFSATMGQQCIDAAASVMHEDRVTIRHSENRKVNRLITHEFVEVEDAKMKNDKLKEIFKKDEADGKKVKTLIFTERKNAANFLAFQLQTMDIVSVAITGDAPQNVRDDMYRKFTSGEITVLIGTDVCARGWDIPHLQRVINYDLPSSKIEGVDVAADKFVHRVGRTGRIHKGVAISLVQPNADRDLTKELIKIVREAGQEAPEWLVTLSESPEIESGAPRGGGGSFGSGGFGGGSFGSSGGFGSNAGSGFGGSGFGNSGAGSGFGNTGSGFGGSGFGESQSTSGGTEGGFGSGSFGGAGFGFGGNATETNTSSTFGGAPSNASTTFGGSGFGSSASTIVPDEDKKEEETTTTTNDESKKEEGEEPKLTPGVVHVTGSFTSGSNNNGVASSSFAGFGGPKKNEEESEEIPATPFENKEFSATVSESKEEQEEPEKDHESETECDW